MAVTVRFKAGDDETVVLNKLNQRGTPVVSSTSDIADPFYGQVIFNTTDNTLYRYNGTAFVPLVGPQAVLQSADQSVNNKTALEDSLDLICPVAENGLYIVESFIIIDSDSTADSVVSFTGPDGSSIRLAFWQDGTAASAINGNLFHDAVDLASVQIGGVALGTWMTFRATGMFTNGPNLGALTIQYAQNVATAINTSLKAGSWLRLTKANTD